MWGKDFDGLNYAEPWVLFAVAVGVSTCSIKYVLLAPAESEALLMSSHCADSGPLTVSHRQDGEDLDKKNK